MEQRSLATFRYAQGKHEFPAPPGHENYFGAPPLYRYLSFDELADDDDDDTDPGVRIPKGLDPEDTMRNAAQAAGRMFPITSYQEALESIFRLLDAEPDIDALLGYSEGAMIAAGIVLEERRRWTESGRERRIKFAIFISGSVAPVRRNDNHTKNTNNNNNNDDDDDNNNNGSEFKLPLADDDEWDVPIDIPTCHVVGSNDTLIHAAAALYNICDRDSAELFDHGRGHIVPRDAQDVDDWVSSVEQLRNHM